MAQTETNKVDYWKEFNKGIIRENPIFVVLLGLCPTLAVTTQTINGLAMGAAVIFVLIMANLFVSLLRNFVPQTVRIPAYIMIIASFVTLVSLFLQAFAPDINKALGIFIPLIVVNCVILGRAEAFSSRHKPLTSVLDGIGMGIGFMLGLTLIAFIRELLGNGSIDLRFAGIGKMFNFSAEITGDPTVVNVKNIIKNPAVVMIMPPGGFLVVGLLLALFQHNRIKKDEKRKKEAAAKKAAAKAAKS